MHNPQYEKQHVARISRAVGKVNIDSNLRKPGLQGKQQAGSPILLQSVDEHLRTSFELAEETLLIKSAAGGGDTERHPSLLPTDEFANFKTRDKGNLNVVAKTSGMIEFEIAREALKRGLKLEDKFATNPFKFGMLGSTRDHTGVSSVVGGSSRLTCGAVTLMRFPVNLAGWGSHNEETLHGRKNHQGDSGTALPLESILLKSTLASYPSNSRKDQCIAILRSAELETL